MTRVRRTGLTLLDVTVAVCVVAFLSAITVAWIEKARITARGVGCRENLRKIGTALAGYTDTHGTLPVVTLAGFAFELSHSPHALLLPFLPQVPAVAYDPTRPWRQQPADVGAATIPAFHCPSSSYPDPVDSLDARRMRRPTGSVLGTTDYIVSKGPNDSWCLKEDASDVPLKRRGAFEIGRTLRPTDISDGLGQTVLVGEGAGGPYWPVCKRRRFPVPYVDPETNEPVTAMNYWCWPLLNSLADQATSRVVATSLFGCTAHVLNAKPVMETIADESARNDCRPTSKDGPHAVSGFRSDHPDGGYFLLADGSVRFVRDGLEPQIYQGLSTIAGGESVQFVD